MTQWTVACQAPPSMGISSQKYWNGLPLPSPGDLPNQGIESRSPALQADSLPFEPPGKTEDNTWPVVIVQHLITIIIFYSVEEPETM